VTENRPALSFFPYSQKAWVSTVMGPDRAGKPIPSEPVEYPCFISMNSDHEPFLDYMGDQVIYTATLMFPFPLKVKVKDIVTFYDDLGKKQQKDVLAVQYKRDFSRQVIAVKVTV